MMDIQHELNKAKVMMLIKWFDPETSDLSAKELFAMMLIAEILEKDPIVETEILNLSIFSEKAKKELKEIFSLGCEKRKNIARGIVIANKMAEECIPGQDSLLDKYCNEYDSSVENKEN